MRTSATDARRARDWTARFAGRLIGWIIPALIMSAASAFGLPYRPLGFVFAGALAWMGTACALNAWRCGRLHCFFTGPALWAGAVGAVLVGLRVLSGAHDLDYVVYGTVALAILSHLPEGVWGRYVRTAGGRGAESP